MANYPPAAALLILRHPAYCGPLSWEEQPTSRASPAYQLVEVNLGSMGQFLCRVADADGRVFSHVEAASSLDEARQKLVDRGLYVYSVESRGGRLLESLRQKSGRQIGGSEFLILNQQFNTLIKAGLPILKSLDLLASRATSPKLRPVISQIRDRVREGKSLSEAVAEAGVFSKVYSTAILAGEKSGNLSGVLDYYIAYQRVSTGVRKKSLASLVYPALLLSVAVIIVTYLVTGVIHDNHRHAKQQRRIDQGSENLFADASTDALVGDVIIQHAGQIATLLSR